LLKDKLPTATSAAVMKNLYGPSGIHLAYTLVPMGASDFTMDRAPYSYDDVPAGRSDPSLSRFSVAHDDAYIVPTLRRMLANNPDVTIIATEWSPPAWMKANQSLSNRGASGRCGPVPTERLPDTSSSSSRRTRAAASRSRRSLPRTNQGRKPCIPG
jgi:hypothetical protein